MCVCVCVCVASCPFKCVAEGEILTPLLKGKEHLAHKIHPSQIYGVKDFSLGIAEDFGFSKAKLSLMITSSSKQTCFLISL